ncbi:MAG: hypothetical protein JAZ15_11835 [Candidatus Thiodiazotropha endolucinida]|nr:hypothetical protein [Candidatus Thiodiazotropha taylori]MCW4343707.1 hypothetical protein [Candidatus Thiodiazotropha endolucinida]MCG8046003.1 hypothetical protein [Candidatus Thiodiazotropha taylori]MCG8051893.1 hypothetical protein [Candidatus Thiodiazotropha taylori]MCW4313712.1 hypothetical protein [Candidatus Thiodiazotropha taylori]
MIDDNTIATSNVDDRLLIEGSLKAMSSIGEKIITPQFCSLQLNDVDADTSDPILRKAFGVFPFETEFDEITGISGSPVFNLTKNALCGMAIRGGMNDSKHCTVWYIDMFDIMKVLQDVHEGRSETFYEKTIRI